MPDCLRESKPWTQTLHIPSQILDQLIHHRCPEFKDAKWDDVVTSEPTKKIEKSKKFDFPNLEIDSEAGESHYR